MKQSSTTMKNKLCPYCQAPARKKCEHLILEARSKDFVKQCIAAAEAKPLWKRLKATKDENAFTTDRAAFCDIYLKPLSEYCAVETNLRLGPEGRRELWAVLWSEDPDSLWFELRSRLDNAADEAEETARNTVWCPICHRNAENECSHLLIHGDDLQVRHLFSKLASYEAWEKILETLPELPDSLYWFFKKYKRQFPSFVRTMQNAWGGDSPGRSGFYQYVFVKNTDHFETEFQEFLEANKATWTGSGDT